MNKHIAKTVEMINDFNKKFLSATISEELEMVRKIEHHAAAGGGRIVTPLGIFGSVHAAAAAHRFNTNA